MRCLGLRNIVTDRTRWRHLLFYDFDDHSPDWAFIDALMGAMHVSYIAYQTKHGFHLVGLTPLEMADHYYLFLKLQEKWPSFYVGQTIRLTPKADEMQTPLFCKRQYGPVIPHLYNLFARRFGLPMMSDDRRQAVPTNKWKLVFERYSTEKI